MPHFKKIRIRIVFLLAAIVIAIAGCSKVTQNNFEKIEAGMTYEEVKDIIGDPTSCEAMFSMKQCVWKNGKKAIDIKLVNDKVILFSGENF